MSGQRKALIVANDEYDQEALRNLVAPAADAEALGRVLSDQQIGEFTVQVVRNKPSYVIQTQIEELFSESLPDDVLLLHFSGHGLKNQSGELFFAASNTRPKLLGSTAVSADFVQRCMRASRSRSIVLLLDCCYGGAFAQGVMVRASGDVNVLDSFPQERTGGRGRAVITASNAMEYAFEGDQLADNQDPRPSVFTSALVEGLATGDADRDEDGWVSLNELYDYVFDKVREHNPHQTPSRAVEMQGELYLARSRRRRIQPASLPPDLQAAVTGLNMYTRLGAVSELGSRLTSDNLPAAAGAYEALTELAHTDIRYVAGPATEALNRAVLHPEETALHFGDLRQGSEPPHRVIKLLGPPIARFCVPRASDDWIHISETAEGFDISVDTSGTGSLHGTVDLKGPTGEVVIAVDVHLSSPLPQVPAPRPSGQVSAPDDHGVGSSADLLEGPPARPVSVAALAASAQSPPEANTQRPDSITDTGVGKLPTDREPSKQQAAEDQAGTAEGHGREDGQDSKSATAEPPPVEALRTVERQPGRGSEQSPQSARAPSLLQVGRPAHAVAFSPDGTRLATGSRGVVRIWDLQKAAAVHELPIGRRKPVTALAFSPDGTRLAGSTAQAARIWNTTTGEQQLEVAHADSSLLAVAFSSDGTRLTTGSDYPYAQIWDATTGQQQLRVPPSAATPWPSGVMASEPSAPTYGKVSAVAFSPNGTRLATGSRGVIRIWDFQTAAAIHELPIGRGSTVTALTFSPDGTRLAGSIAQAARIWDTTTGEEQQDMTHGPDSVLAVAFSPDGTRLATGSNYRYVRVWNATSGQLELEEAHGDHSVLAVTFSPDGTRLATGASDEIVRIWDIANG